LPKLARLILAGRNTRRIAASVRHTTDIISCRAAAGKSVISATWSRQITRQNAGAAGVSFTAITRSRLFCHSTVSFSARHSGQEAGISVPFRWFNESGQGYSTAAGLPSAGGRKAT